jgi:hypothetical protein
LNGIFQTKCKVWIELNLFEYLIAKGSIQNLMWMNTTRMVSRSMTSFLIETMNKLDIVLVFKAKTINIDEIILPMRNINNLEGASTLCALK